jgi:CubicO group peptidase (beta-lactamase class C family)
VPTVRPSIDYRNGASSCDLEEVLVTLRPDDEHRKPVPEVSNTAFAWGGLYGTEYIIDPENDMIALFYLNMPRHDPLYPLFLSKAYQLFKK